jgi:hypothetical protein
MGEQSRPAAVVAEGNDIYWINEGDGTVLGARTSIDTVAEGQVAVRSGLAVTGAHVYWVDDDPGAGPAVFRASRDDDSVVELVRLLPERAGGGASLAVDGDSLYFVAAGCTVAKAPAAGGEATILSFDEALGCPVRLAATGGELYFTSAAGVVRVTW